METNPVTEVNRAQRRNDFGTRYRGTVPWTDSAGKKLISIHGILSGFKREKFEGFILGARK